MKEYINGTPWLDTDGNEIHAHGGYIINHEGYYYWYGENRIGDNYVSCYRSEDLLNWEFRNNVLTTHSKCERGRVLTPQSSCDLRLSNENSVTGKVNIERPKVLYNKLTKKFVMWAHFENGENYSDARTMTATCDTPDGDFTYHGSFRPYGEESRDCTLFYDEDADKAYFISSSRGNLDTHVYRLTKDYRNLDKFEAVLFHSEAREAPAFFKKDGEYFDINSFCTGWEPNQGKFSRSKELCDNWDILRDFGDETTFRSQPAFILPVTKDGKTDYYYFGDRWCYKGEELIIDVKDTLFYYKKSTYVVLKIEFDAEGNPFIEMKDTFEGI